LEIRKKEESKLLDRVELEVLIPEKAGKLSRGEAIAMVADEMKVGRERVGLIMLKQQSGTRDVVGRFGVYGSEEAMKRTHPEHLTVRLMTKEEREKLKQAKKKAKTPTTEAK
jgi:ribosomal protein S24E